MLPPRPAGQAACARATLPGLSCSTWLCCPEGEQKTLGPSRSFLEKAPRYWTVFALNLHIFANFLSVVLPEENGNSQAQTNWKRGNEIITVTDIIRSRYQAVSLHASQLGAAWPRFTGGTEAEYETCLRPKARKACSQDSN